MIKTYKIPVIWQSVGICEIEAESLQEAIEKAENGPLPNNSSYIDDSFEIDCEGISFHN